MMLIYNSKSNLIELCNTQSRVLPADWLILRYNEGQWETLNINKPYLNDMFTCDQKTFVVMTLTLWCLKSGSQYRQQLLLHGKKLKWCCVLSIFTDLKFSECIFDCNECFCAVGYAYFIHAEYAAWIYISIFFQENLAHPFQVALIDIELYNLSKYFKEIYCLLGSPLWTGIHIAFIDISFILILLAGYQYQYHTHNSIKFARLIVCASELLLSRLVTPVSIGRNSRVDNIHSTWSYTQHSYQSCIYFTGETSHVKFRKRMIYSPPILTGRNYFITTNPLQLSQEMRPCEVGFFDGWLCIWSGLLSWIFITVFHASREGGRLSLPF